MFAINSLIFIDDPLNSASLSDFLLPIETHPGASDFFTKSGLYTNIKNRRCVLIDGKCSRKQLSEHHLYHNFGPTFDQLFNSETTNNPYVLKNEVPLVLA
jgi:hypothetical protein